MRGVAVTSSVWSTAPMNMGSITALNSAAKVAFSTAGAGADAARPPMYGKAEAALGQLLEQTGTGTRAFVATKVWTTGRAAGVRQMENSLRLLRTDTVDLMQVHNLVDWPEHLATLRQWKE